MASGSQIRSLARFLYTQNPFYLISCFLVLYGLQIATIADGNPFSRSIFLTVSIAAYTLLMAITCVGVVRLGKVWEDARSIFLVVIISIIALSGGLDELCVSDWQTAGVLLTLGLALAVLITESVLRGCRLRFPAWYRLAFYALLLVFFVMPVVLGRAVGHNYLTLTNWGAPLFSTLVAAGLLLLIPAMREAESLVADNGSPWRWPLYPLTAFVILVVLAGIRTHAIWMSFGFIGQGVTFEPFLLLPIMLAILVLMVEFETSSKAPAHAHTAMWVAPAMLICGLSQGGMTHLPIQADLQLYFGSAKTIALAALLGFYVYVWIRGVAGCEIAVTATLFALYGWSDLSELAESAGLMHWMYLPVASMLTLVVALRQPSSDLRWLAFTMVSAATILAAGHAYDHVTEAIIAAAAFAVAGMMTIGALLETNLAVRLRQVSAAMLVVAAVAVLGWHVARSPGMTSPAVLVGLSVVSITYMQIVRRRGWLAVFGFQIACQVGLLGWSGYQSGSLSETSWPIPSGLLCFVVGLTITSMKTGVHRRCWRRRPGRQFMGPYRSGW